MAASQELPEGQGSTSPQAGVAQDSGSTASTRLQHGLVPLSCPPPGDAAQQVWVRNGAAQAQGVEERRCIWLAYCGAHVHPRGLEGTCAHAGCTKTQQWLHCGHVFPTQGT